jgi:hypothetical protein
MDYGEELAKAKQALAARSATAQRNRATAQLKTRMPSDSSIAFDASCWTTGRRADREIVIERAPDDLAEAEVRLGWRLATLRAGDQKDHGDTVLVLFSDRTDVAEAEYFREFESCTVRWSKGSSSDSSGALSPEVIQGIAEFLEAHRLDWDGR